MNTNLAPAVDNRARERFLSDMEGYAGIYAINSMTYAPCLNKRIADFRNGKRGARDAVRAAVHLEAAGLKNAEARVLAFHLAVEDAGFSGTCAPEEVLSVGVINTTGGLCAGRTYRGALAGLCRKGWLSKTLVPTGTRVVVGTDDSGAIWRSLKVNKIHLTRSARMLVSFKPPTSTHRSLPRQKPPATVGDKDTAIPENSCIPCQSDQNLDTSRVSQEVGSKESSLRSDESTSPKRAQRASTVKHRQSTRASRKTASKAAVVAASARKSRNAASTTWDSARATLLRDLFVALKTHPHREEIVRIVKLQTDRRYPTACMSITNWEKWVWKWPSFSYHDAMRACRNQLIPLVLAFLADLHPPDTSVLDNSDLPEETRKKILTDLESHKRLSVWLHAIPATLPNDIPKIHRDKLNAERWRLNRIVYRIHTGDMSLKDLTKDDHDLLAQASICQERW